MEHPGQLWFAQMFVHHALIFLLLPPVSQSTELCGACRCVCVCVGGGKPSNCMCKITHQFKRIQIPPLPYAQNLPGELS